MAKSDPKTEKLGKKIVALARENQRDMKAVVSDLKTLAAKKPNFDYGLTTDYMKIIKKSGGLTSARPSCVKILQKIEKDPTTADLKLAANALRKHLDDVKKENKGGKSKDLVKLENGITSLISDLKSMLKKLSSIESDVKNTKAKIAKLLSKLNVTVKKMKKA